MSRSPSLRQAAALARECPTCGAKPGERCARTPRGGYSTSAGTPMRYAHPRRYRTFVETMAEARDELRARGVVVDASRWPPPVELPPPLITVRDRLPEPEQDGDITVWPKLPLVDLNQTE